MECSAIWTPPRSSLGQTLMSILAPVPHVRSDLLAPGWGGRSKSWEQMPHEATQLQNSHKLKFSDFRKIFDFEGLIVVILNRVAIPKRFSGSGTSDFDEASFGSAQLDAAGCVS